MKHTTTYLVVNIDFNPEYTRQRNELMENLRKTIKEGYELLDQLREINRKNQELAQKCVDALQKSIDTLNSIKW